MSNCQIRFRYNQEDIVIQCQRNESMRDIINRFWTKSLLPVDEFYFLYDGNKINPVLSLDHLNSKDAEIIILVNPKENKRNEDNTKKSNIIKYFEYYEPAIVEFSNDYKIILSNENREAKKIKLQDYNSSQIIDQTKIKCFKCSHSKADTYQNKFYYCFECDNNFCPMCQSLHKEHKNIVDYSLKYFRCSQHPGKEFISYCITCKKNLCIFCKNQHKTHNTVNFDDLLQEQNKELFERIQKIEKLVDTIVDSLQKFKENLNTYVQINEKLNENLLNMNLNYENLKNMKNLKEISFLNKDIDEILNNNDINKKFQKIMSIYDIMNNKAVNTINFDYNTDQITENNNEISIKIKIEQSDINSTIYFLDNTKESDKNYFENGEYVKHNHDNLREMNKFNTTLIIDEIKVPFKKYFNPKNSGIYSIKLAFKNKLSNCAYMFCNCKNIIDIDFSKFNTEDVNDMKSMFNGCSGLKMLNLQTFNTGRVTDMCSMFFDCSSLTSLNLRTFKTYNVVNMTGMFYNCSSLKTLDLSSFAMQNVTNVWGMFNECSSLTFLNLSSSFNTQKVTNMTCMFQRCSSLKTLSLSSFNTKNVTSMWNMFYECSSLTSLNLSSFNTQNVTNMTGMFYNCSSLIKVDLSSFNTAKADTTGMFMKCRNLKSCSSSDRKIVNEFKKK